MSSVAAQTRLLVGARCSATQSTQIYRWGHHTHLHHCITASLHHCTTAEVNLQQRCITSTSLKHNLKGFPIWCNKLTFSQGRVLLKLVQLTISPFYKGFMHIFCTWILHYENWEISVFTVVQPCTTLLHHSQCFVGPTPQSCIWRTAADEKIDWRKSLL